LKKASLDEESAKVPKPPTYLLVNPLPRTRTTTVIYSHKMVRPRFGEKRPMTSVVGNKARKTIILISSIPHRP
jgi:hypothetical protein